MSLVTTQQVGTQQLRKRTVQPQEDLNGKNNKKADVQSPDVSKRDQQALDRVTRTQVLSQGVTPNIEGVNESYSFIGPVLKMMGVEKPLEGGLSGTLMGLEKGLFSVGNGTLNGMEYVGRSLFGNEKQGGLFGNAPQQMAKDTVDKGTKVANTILENKDLAIGLTQATLNLTSSITGSPILNGPAIATNFLAALNAASKGDAKGMMASSLLGAAKLFPQLELLNVGLTLTQVPGLAKLLTAVTKMASSGKTPGEMAKEINGNPELKGSFKSFIGIIGGKSMGPVLQGVAVIDILTIFAKLYGASGQTCTNDSDKLWNNSTITADNNNPPQAPFAKSTDHVSLRAEKVPSNSVPGTVEMAFSAPETFNGPTKVEVFPGNGPITNGANKLTVSLSNSQGGTEKLDLILTIDKDGQTAKLCSPNECTDESLVTWLNNRLNINFNALGLGGTEVSVTLPDSTPKGEFMLPSPISFNGYDRVDVNLESDSDSYIFTNVYEVEGYCGPLPSPSPSPSHTSSPSPTFESTMESSTMGSTMSPSGGPTGGPSSTSSSTPDPTVDPPATTGRPTVSSSSPSPTGNNPDTPSPSDTNPNPSSPSTSDVSKGSPKADDPSGLSNLELILIAGGAGICCLILVLSVIMALVVARRHSSSDSKELQQQLQDVHPPGYKELIFAVPEENENGEYQVLVVTNLNTKERMSAEEVTESLSKNDQGSQFNTMVANLKDYAPVELPKDEEFVSLPISKSVQVKVPPLTQGIKKDGRICPYYNLVDNGTQLPLSEHKDGLFYVDTDGIRVYVPKGTKVTIQNGLPIPSYEGVEDDTVIPVSKGSKKEAFFVGSDGMKRILPEGSGALVKFRNPTYQPGTSGTESPTQKGYILNDPNIVN